MHATSLMVGTDPSDQLLATVQSPPATLFQLSVHESCVGNGAAELLIGPTTTSAEEISVSAPTAPRRRRNMCCVRFMGGPFSPVPSPTERSSITIRPPAVEQETIRLSSSVRAPFSSRAQTCHSVRRSTRSESENSTLRAVFALLLEPQCLPFAFKLDPPPSVGRPSPRTSVTW
jgi:hypothetical protein